jgi:hypothetical protein
MTTLTAVSRLPMTSAAGYVLGFASSITPTQILDQTNKQRAAQGLPALELNSKLSQAALAKGQHMFLEQYWAHTAPDGTQPWKFFKDAGYTYKVAGENLARDFGNTDDMMSAWMASPTHRANIVSERYQEIGIAVIDGTLEGYETTLVVQLFGTPATLAASVDAPATAKVSAAPEVEEPLLVNQPEDSESPLETVTIEPGPATELVVPTSLDRQATIPSPAVLASALVPRGSISVPPLFSPLQITKAFFLAMIMMIVATLMYDSLVIGHRSVMRLVGHNLGHVILFTVVAFLLLSFRGGILG